MGERERNIEREREKKNWRISQWCRMENDEHFPSDYYKVMGGLNL
jgi:hypothetical protein